MPVLRQLTTCTAPATHVIERHSLKAGRPLEYRLGVCDRARGWLSGWKGKPGDVDRFLVPCGTLIDHRPYPAVVESHFDEWLGSMSTQRLEDHGGDIAATLRAAHAWLAEGSARFLGAHEPHDALTVAVGQAARLAELMATGYLETEPGQAQLLAVLAVAETIAAAQRGL
jgi:hypothetical protein